MNLHSVWRATDNLELTLGVNNVFGQAYRKHGSVRNESDRNLVADIKTNF